MKKYINFVCLIHLTFFEFYLDFSFWQVLAPVTCVFLISTLRSILFYFPAGSLLKSNKFLVALLFLEEVPCFELNRYWLELYDFFLWALYDG